MIVLFLPVVYSAMSYPVSSVVIVSATSVVTYLGLASQPGGTNLAFYTVSSSRSSWRAQASSPAAGRPQNQNRQHRALAKASAPTR